MDQNEGKMDQNEGKMDQNVSKWQGKMDKSYGKMNQIGIKCWKIETIFRVTFKQIKSILYQCVMRSLLLFFAIC